MKIACVSDLHGNLPEVPDADVLVIAGDIVPTTCHRAANAAVWLRSAFGPWLERLATRMEVVGVAGNHDFIFHERPDLVPPLKWHYLRDSGVVLGGLHFWGSPWQPEFGGWAFNLRESELLEKWALIPDDTDVLVTHGPPRGVLDRNVRGEECGSYTLASRVQELRDQGLSVHCFGHIHEGRGEWRDQFLRYVNASLVDHLYRPVHAPVVLEV